MIPFYQAILESDGRHRITCSVNGFTIDVCGAISADVAWQQADILNRMHRART